MLNVSLEAVLNPKEVEIKHDQVLVSDELRVESLCRSKTSTREISRSDAPPLLQKADPQREARRQRQRLATAL